MFFLCSCLTVYLLRRRGYLLWNTYRISQMDSTVTGQPYEKCGPAPLKARHTDRPTMLANNLQAVRQTNPHSQDAPRDIGRPAELVKDVRKVGGGYSQSLVRHFHDGAAPALILTFLL